MRSNGLTGARSREAVSNKLNADYHVFASGIVSEKEQLLKKLNDCLSDHACNRDMNVDMLAKLMHMSRPTLYRKIKCITPLTPNELINGARLNKAAILLAAGGHRAFEVAGMVGYSSQSRFGKIFLRHFKVTPASYQRIKKMQILPELPVSRLLSGHEDEKY